jgi:hypothetical protein
MSSDGVRHDHAGGLAARPGVSKSTVWGCSSKGEWMARRQQYGNTVSTHTAQKWGTERAVESFPACAERLA